LLTLLVVATAALGLLIWWRRFWQTHEPMPGATITTLASACLAFFGVPMALGGALLVITGLQTYWTMAQVHAWPQTEGTILSSSVYISEGIGKNKRTGYSPRVTYSYTVPGSEALYHGDKVKAGPMGFSYPSLATAEKFRDSHPAGAKVPIYFNPDDPADSALERDVAPGGWIPILSGTISATVGAALSALAVYLLRRSVATRNEK
jgi:hypothetical protein